MVITIKVMLESPEIDVKKTENLVKEKLASFDIMQIRFEVEPIAFGLNAIKATFVLDENEGPTDAIEEELKSLDGVGSVETVDVRRAIG